MFPACPEFRACQPVAPRARLKVQAPTTVPTTGQARHPFSTMCGRAVLLLILLRYGGALEEEEQDKRAIKGDDPMEASSSWWIGATDEVTWT